MRDAVLLDGIGKRVGDVLLPDDVSEPLRAILAGYDLVGHLNLCLSLFTSRAALAHNAASGGHRQNHFQYPARQHGHGSRRSGCCRIP